MKFLVSFIGAALQPFWAAMRIILSLLNSKLWESKLKQDVKREPKVDKSFRESKKIKDAVPETAGMGLGALASNVEHCENENCMCQPWNRMLISSEKPSAFRKENSLPRDIKLTWKSVDEETSNFSFNDAPKPLKLSRKKRISVARASPYDTEYVNLWNRNRLRNKDALIH